MKRYLLFATILFTLIISIASAAALTADSDKINLGDENQEASNFDEKPYGEYDTSEIIFGTTDSITITDVDPEQGYVQSSSTVVNNINITITNQQSYGSASSTVTVSGRIPENLDAVDIDGKASSFKVAVVTFSDGSTTKQIPIYMQRENKLEFEDIEMEYGDEIDNIDDGNEIDELMPGDSATMHFEIANLFSSSSDVEIDDVTIEMTDNGDELDIDEEEDIGTIEEDDEETESISFEIDDNADEGTYKLYLTVTGEDDYGAIHGQEYIIDVEIEKEDDYVTLKKIDLNPDSLRICQKTQTTLTVSIENNGANDQDEAAIIVRNSELGLYEIVDQIEIEEDESSTKRFIIYVPDNTEKGTYRLLIEAINDDEDVTDSETVTLYIDDCKEQQTTQESQSTTSTDTEVVNTGVDLSGKTSAQAPVQKTTDEKEEQIPLNILLVFLIFVLAAIGVLVYLLSKE